MPSHRSETQDDLREQLTAGQLAQVRLLECMIALSSMIRMSDCTFFWQVRVKSAFERADVVRLSTFDRPNPLAVCVFTLDFRVF